MEEKAETATTPYNTNNYTQKSSTTYIAPNGTTIKYSNIGTNPSNDCDAFV